MAGGYVDRPEASGSERCGYCQVESTNQFLTGINIEYGGRWQDWDILCVYIVFNVAAAVFLYWLMRVPKDKKKPEKEEEMIRSK